ncbi:hypothetical protein B0H12DRAFT_1132829 [Mycena haematopus]|nr:hypothetical protein B0H12DRAFT_1132829 [Mycena haematopus]
MIRPSDLSRRRSGALVSIPEEAGPPDGSSTSWISRSTRHLEAAPHRSLYKSSAQVLVDRLGSLRRSPSEIVLAVSPVRTLCCSHLFCADHIMAWLHGPASDGLCPSCGTRGLDVSLLALGHPSLTRPVPPAPPPTPRSPSPVLSPTTSIAPYASYPSTPAVLSRHDPATSSSEEEEDATDYSLPALVYARALQTRRHTPHPFSSVVGVRGALERVGRIAVWLGLVAVLASRGRWVND